MPSVSFLKFPGLALFGFAMLATAAAQKPVVHTDAHPSVRITEKVDTKVTQKLAGTHPQFIASAKVGARLQAGTTIPHLHLMLSASPDQEAALQTLMAQQQDRTSANYHQWLTPESFGTYFGASSSDIAKVTAWMQDQGLTVESVAKSGRMITFTGSAGQIESAFKTQLNTVQINGGSHFSNTTDISIPQALTSVVKGVARLNDIYPQHTPGKMSTVKLDAANNAVPADNTPFYGTSTGTHYVSPGDAAVIYNTVPLTAAGTDGTGTTISVLAQSNIDLADVEKFRSMFGLVKNDPTVTVIGSDPGENGDDVEAFLDAEWAGALAPGAKVNFIVSAGSLEGGGVDVSALYAVENNIGDIISLSYGGCEYLNGQAESNYFNQLWEQAAAQGQTVFVSSGDSGAAGCTSSSATSVTPQADSSNAGVNALGSSNFNVAMGGSIFVDFNPTQYWNNNGAVIPFVNAISYIPEAPVNQGKLAQNELNSASTAYMTGSGIFSDGGGISIYNARPSWQTGSGIPTTTDNINVMTGTVISASPITGLHRLVPDLVNISANGHDGTLFCAGSICSTTSTGALNNAGIVGGTSVATPVQAGIQALINQKNGGRQGNILPILYKLSNTQYTASTTACQSTLGTTTTSTPTLPASTCNFNDIVSGSNIVPLKAGGGTGYSAGVGFDEASGLGSMNVANVATNWASVGLVATTTSFTLSPAAGIVHGATQNLAATVSAASGTPTGDISLIAEVASPNGPHVYTLTAGSFSGTVASGAITSATLSAITGALPAGNYNVHVHYAGDGNFAPSDSPSSPVSIAKEGSAVSVSTYNVTTAGNVNSATAFAYAADVYADVFVNGTSNTGVPTGNVTYTLTRNGAAAGSLTVPLDAQGNSYFLAGQSFPAFYLKPNFPVLAPGSYTLTIAYAGDNSFAASTTSTPFTVSTLAKALNLSVPAQITSGGTAILGASLINPSTTANPEATVAATGTVTFTDTTTSATLGSCTLSSAYLTGSNLPSGACSFSTTAITTAGANTIAAVYSGDANYASATATGTVTVGTLTAPTLTLSTTSSLTVGTDVVLKATMAPTSVTGTVAFYDGNTYLGSGTLASGVYSLTLGSTTAGYGILQAGTHNFSATYGGSTTYSTATGTLTSTIAQSTTALTLSAPANSTYGQTVVFSVYQTRTPTTGTTIPAIVPTGPVNFYSDGNLVASGLLTFDPAGYAYFVAAGSTAAIPAGSHTITATYVGDNNFTSSTASITPTLTVAQVTPTLVLSTANNGGSNFFNTGSAVSLQVVIPATSAQAVPTGTLTFTNVASGAQNTSAKLSYNAAAGGFVGSIALSGLSGTQSYVVTLASDTNYNAASSNTLVIQVVTSNVWVANGNGTVTGLSNTGTAVTASAQTGGGTAIAIDNAGDVWSLNKTGSKVSEYSSAGILISGGTTVGGLNLPTSLAIDGAGLVWVTNGGSVGTLSVLSAPGTAVSASGYSVLLSSPTSISIDASGNLWITNSGDNSVTEVFGAATPVTTPTSNAVKTNTLAAKP